MSSSVAILCLLVFFTAFGPHHGAAARETNSAHATKSLSITDTGTLRAMEGKTVTLTGTVSSVSTSKSKFLTLISFDGVERGGFMAIVHSSHITDLERSVGSTLEAALPSRKVTITGAISLYQSSPQIELKTSDQLRLHP